MDHRDKYTYPPQQHQWVESRSGGRPGPSGGGSGGGSGRGVSVLLASALVGGLVAAVVSLGIASLDDDPQGNALTGEPSAQEAAVPQQEGPQLAPVPEGNDDDVVVGASVADVAEDVLPSTAQVVAGGQPIGSAVVYREDGYLITNNHVVEGAAQQGLLDQLSVTLANGENLDAEVVGTDARSDLAVLQVDADGLPPIEFAEGSPQAGETAIAIGSPFGLGSTVTSGIVSATEREVAVPQAAPLVDMIQTDAAINPGNSGGALVNAQGELIGINTAIFSPSGANSGIGFAVPASTVQTVAEQLIEQGYVEYALLGVSARDVTPSVAEQFGLAAEEGALVASVQPGTGADDADIRQGDIIVEVDGEEITSSSALVAAVRSYEPGDEVTIALIRDGERQETTVTLGTAR